MSRMAPVARPLSISPGVLPLLTGALLTVVAWPGELLSDSVEQLKQAQLHRFLDWHPPMMAWLWSHLLDLGLPPGSLMVLHQALYAIGFALFAGACYRTGKVRAAWLVAFASCFPLFVFYNRIVIKDVGMASALIFGTGLLFWYHVQDKARPWWATVLAALALFYGIAVRINAIFALGPLLLLFFERPKRWPLPAVVGASVLVAVAALPVTDVLNHRVLGAERQDVMQQLQIYDLMGIEARTGDTSVWGPYQVKAEDARRCYTPVWWDTFSTWGACAALRNAFHERANDTAPEVMAERSRLWKAAIVQHPFAYAAHRLSHFNSELYFFVPSFHLRYKHLQGEPAAIEEAKTLGKRKLLDYAKMNVFFWPVTWLTVGLGLLWVFGGAGAAAAPRETSFARLLIVSGVLFASAYALIGIATDVRYHYWLIAAVMLAALISLDAWWPPVRRSGRPYVATLCVAGVIALGLLARFADVALR
jgi:hypothetical protein